MHERLYTMFLMLAFFHDKRQEKKTVTSACSDKHASSKNYMYNLLVFRRLLVFEQSRFSRPCNHNFQGPLLTHAGSPKSSSTIPSIRGCTLISCVRICPVPSVTLSATDVSTQTHYMLPVAPPHCAAAAAMNLCHSLSLQTLKSELCHVHHYDYA